MKEKYWEPIYNFYKTNVLYIIAFFALVSLLIAYTCFDKEHWAFDILKSLGFTLISGGVFAVIVKSEQFSKIFHDELRGIIYGDENLKNRNDLDILWEKVTKALCNQKFKLISKKLHNSIKTYYLPIKHEFYYRNQSVEIYIEIDKVNPDYITLTEETKTVLMSDDTKEICYEFQSTIPMIEGEEAFTEYEMTNFKINNVNVKLSDEQLVVSKSKSLSVKGCYKVSGSTKYTIVRKEKKRYNLKANSSRTHHAIWLYENFTLDLNYPKELEIKFIEMGVINDWSLERKDNRAYCRLIAHYEGLIFKKQGYVLLLNKL